MRLLFGLAADGRTHPSIPQPEGAIDARIVGPMGLVETLEVQLGLAGPPVPRVVRTASYLAKLREGRAVPRFWDASFQRDPWSTAVELLAWRDSLRCGGWTLGPVGVRRVDDLAAAEASGPPLPAGLADRAVGLTAALPLRPGLRVTDVELLDPPATMPRVWQRLLAALADVGVRVHARSHRADAAEGTDLRRVQSSLRGEPAASLGGDGSLVVVEADTALMAAVAVAEWLSAGTAEALAETVVIAPDGDTALLDRVLRARGLPSLGLSGRSSWRGALQILPLAFATAWLPFDAEAMLGLLTLHRPPMPPFAASRLSSALAAEPGIGGRAWTAAWDHVSGRALELAAEAGEGAEVRVAADVARWHTWTDGARFERSAGIPADEARLIALRVAKWAIDADEGAGDDMLLAVASLAGDLAAAIDRLGRGMVPALLLDRLVGQVMAEGLPDPSKAPEACGPGAVAHPGAIWSPAASIVWWDFFGPGEEVPRQPWSVGELAGLEAADVRLDPAEAASARIAATYSEVVHRASERVLLVRPAFVRSERTVAHPLAHQLRPILEAADTGVSFRAERLLLEPGSTFGGRTVRRDACPPIPPPVARAVWTIPAVAAARLQGRRESATSLERLLGCQMAWLAHDVLGLRRGIRATLPGSDQILGTMAHEIIRRMLRPGAPPAVAGVRRAAADLLENLLPAMAAPMLRQGAAGELAAAREMVPDAVEALVALLHERRLEVVGTELERGGRFDGLDLRGRIDLLVRRGQAYAVLDMKWTRSEHGYRERIEEGRAVQLAVYHGIAGRGNEMGDGGYYLLRQRRVLASPVSILSDDPLDATHGDAETLRRARSDWALWQGLAVAGTVVAEGVEGGAGCAPEGLGLARTKEPCRFCDLSGLCRVRMEGVR